MKRGLQVPVLHCTMWNLMNDEIVSHEHGAAYVDVCFENYPPKDESRDVGS